LKNHLATFFIILFLLSFFEAKLTADEKEIPDQQMQKILDTRKLVFEEIRKRRQKEFERKIEATRGDRGSEQRKQLFYHRMRQRNILRKFQIR
jgi:hypothetical protein